MDQNNLEIIKTSDLYLASYLLAKGYDINGIDKNNIHRVIFYFSKTSEVENNIIAYINGEAMIEPQSYERAKREVKNKIYGPKSYQKYKRNSYNRYDIQREKIHNSSQEDPDFGSQW